MKEQLYLIIHTREDWRGKLFDHVIQTLILLSIITHSVETVPKFKAYWNFFNNLEAVFMLLFIIEYVLRIFTARYKKQFIFSFYGMVDFLAIVPGLLTVGLVDLRFLRILRLLRIFRVLKLLRYSEALNRMVSAFKEIKEELVIFSVLSCMILYISAAGIYYFEHKVQPEAFSSIPQSLWWAVATLTTVGYGDIYPVTAGGRIFTTVILFIGIGIISVPSALLAHALGKINEHDYKNSKRYQDKPLKSQDN
jgi:voltage-gated potassium channel